MSEGNLWWEIRFNPYDVLMKHEKDLQDVASSLVRITDTMLLLNNELKSRQKEIIYLKKELDAHKEVLKELNGYKAHTALQAMTINDIKQRLHTLTMEVKELQGIKL